MGYSKYVKTKDDYKSDRAVFEIITKNPGITPTKIKKIISEKPFKLSFTRMGLWKILDRLEKGREIESKTVNGEKTWNVLSRSKMRAEMEGVGFHVDLKHMMFTYHKEFLREYATVGLNEVDELLRFFGFFVLASLIVSRSKKYVIQRNEWLKMALDLEKGVSMSSFFDAIFTNDKKIEKLILKLKERYKLSMAALAVVLEYYIDIHKRLEESGPPIKIQAFLKHWNSDTVEEFKKFSDLLREPI